MWKKLKGRSAAEYRFRLRQELGNGILALWPPKLKKARAVASPILPEPPWAALRQSGFDQTIVALADSILARRIPLLGFGAVQFPIELPWRRDFLHQKESGLAYLRRIPYLDFDQVGDHKIIWELNRHQHLVILAQAGRLTGRPEFFADIALQLEHWWRENPFQRGINWTSALEVAFRALSWIWVDHLAGKQLPPATRARLVENLYRHGWHLELNLSHYFSPNTHLQGEAVALHAIGALYPELPRARHWASLGQQVIAQEQQRQVFSDGGHFERSSYYHVYATDLFLFHHLLTGRPASDVPLLERMADYLHALLGPDRSLSFVGDDDGGRLFHPYGRPEHHGRATLATCAILFGRPEWLASPDDLWPQAAWWLGEEALTPVAPAYAPARSRLFAASGTAILARGRFWVLVDVGTFGALQAGHSHADSLSVVVRFDGEETLIDPGTYTYVGDPVWRNRFRSTAAHNTIAIDGLDQVPARNPFAWTTKPEVRVTCWESGPDRDVLEAECVHVTGARHRRRLTLDAHGLEIEDVVEFTDTIPHLVEQYWHPGMPLTVLDAHRAQWGSIDVAFSAPATRDDGGEVGWWSRAYGQKQASPLLRVRQGGVTGAVRFHTTLRPCPSNSHP